MTRPLALVTGASLGIGLELARELAKNGHDLVLVARSVEKLNVLAAELSRAFGVTAHVIAMDLSRPQAAPALYAAVQELGVDVDVLVNNAGFGLYGRFLELDPDENARMLQLNMVFLTEVSRLFADAMVQRRRGRILNVASTAAFQPGPLMSTYYATKAYVLSFSEALANELHDSGVTVTALCPGPTASGFQEKAQMQGSRLTRLAMMSSAEVARFGIKAMSHGQVVAIPGLTNSLLAQSVRFTPRAWVRCLSRYLSERKSA